MNPNQTEIEEVLVFPELDNVLQLYAVACRLCAVGKLRIGAVISWLRLFTEKLKRITNKNNLKNVRWQN